MNFTQMKRMLVCTTNMAAVEYKMDRSMCGQHVRLRKFVFITTATEMLILNDGVAIVTQQFPRVSCVNSALISIT